MYCAYIIALLPKAETVCNDIQWLTSDAAWIYELIFQEDLAVRAADDNGYNSRRPGPSPRRLVINLSKAGMLASVAVIYFLPG